MARRSRKRARKEQLDGSSNNQEAQKQPTEINAEEPQLLYPETESTLSKVPEIKMVEGKEVNKIEGEERNEPNQFRSEPDSTPAKETIAKSMNDLDSEHQVLCHKLDPLTPKDTNPVLLPEPEPVVVKNDTNGPFTEPNSTTPRKKRRKKKGKSLPTGEGAETNDVQSEHLGLIPNLGPLSPKESDPVLLPEPEPVAEKNETNGLCSEPVSATPNKKRRKRKGKSLSTSEGTETNDVHSEYRELIPNLDPLSPKDSDPVLLPKPEPVAEKNEETNKLCAEPESTTPRKKKRKRKGKGKGKNLSTGVGTETNNVHSEHPELIPKLDPLPQKDSDSILLPQPESFVEKNGTNQLCTEPGSATPRKKRKAKRKSLSKSEGVEVNHVGSEHRELCPDLAALPRKDPDPLLLPEPAPVGEKNEANQLCTEPDSTSPKFEGAEVKDMDSENLDLCPKLDPLPHKNSDSPLLPESEPAAPKGVDQKKKRKKRKNKSELEGGGVESNRPNDEERNQRKRKRKRQVMNETPDSSVQSMVIPDILNGEAVGRGPWTSKRPLKDYERYERCLECRQICQGDQTCRGLIHRRKHSQICYFCGTLGHLLGKCPMSPGAKCASGIIMLDEYVKKKCCTKSKRNRQKVAPANMPADAPISTPFLPSNIQPYPAPFVRPSSIQPYPAPFVRPSNIQPYPAPFVRPTYVLL